MQSLSTAQTLAQRSTASLARRAASANSSRALLSSTASPSSFFSTSTLRAVSPYKSSSAAPWTVSSQLPTGPPSCHQQRCFSQSAVCLKKGGGKKDKKEKKGGGSSGATSTKEDSGAGDDEGGSGSLQADPNEPFNWADVETRWDRSDAHHQDKVKELRRSFGGGSDSEGGIDIDAIGRTPVKSGEEHGAGDGADHHKHHHGKDKHAKDAASATLSPSSSSASTTPLSQLALIIPRGGGRVVELRMHSATSRKAIISAVQANPLFRGQQPQPDPDDELVLVVKMGGEKASSSAEAAAERTRRVRDLANAWRDQIRKTTARRQKAHQTWKKSGQVSRTDDLRLLDKELLKKQQQRMASIDEAEKKLLADAQKGR